MNFLSYCPRGLNDSFLTLLFLIDAALSNNWDLNSIYFAHFKYKNLDKYLNFKQINYIKNIDILANNHLLITNGHYLLNNRIKLSSFVSFKKEFLDQLKLDSNYIAIHFRFVSIETKNFKKKQEDIELYKNKFLTIYKKTENYWVCCDCPVLEPFLEQFPNVKFLKKTEFETPGTLFFKNEECFLEDSTLKAMTDLAIMGNSKILYKTAGNFTNLAKSLSTQNNLPQIINL